MQYLLKDEPRTLNKTKLLSDKYQFAYIREISYKDGEHPVEKLFTESDIKISPITRNSGKYGVATLITNGNHPTRSLSHKQINAASQYIASKGCLYEINKDFNNFEWAIGVESDQLYEAAAAGKKVTLISTGNGDNLFANMFPNAEILRLES